MIVAIERVEVSEDATEIATESVDSLLDTLSAEQPSKVPPIDDSALRRMLSNAIMLTE